MSNWDVSSVTNMDGMFFGARSFNQDLSKWTVKEPDFSVREEDFKIEPIKTLFKLSKELSEKEYHKKAVDIWKEYIKKIIWKIISGWGNPIYDSETGEEYNNEKFTVQLDDGFVLSYETFDFKKDLFFIELEYINNNHCPIEEKVRIITYKNLKDSNFFKDDYESIDDFISDSFNFDLQNTCQLSYIVKGIKPTESQLVFLANSDYWGNYEERGEPSREHLEYIGWDLTITDITESEPNSYEDWKKYFFSFDQLCEYLAKCKIYDYKEALEAGALGEDIDFRHFDISKMEK